ncbi:Hypothetical_protein [Hexamita inflata]|uniref:Hypothetical_protein n=1 Tax=Hexamita inflata TaxID=28002 RepID=A0AA86QKD5_9EUKA|nr:Hypothetical protein HINF_LOCUS42952 [Hexamita inflata]
MSVNGKTMYAQTKSINNEIQKSANQYQKQKEMLEVTQVIMAKCLSKKSYLTNLTWFEKLSRETQLNNTAKFIRQQQNKYYHQLESEHQILIQIRIIGLQIIMICK